MLLLFIKNVIWGGGGRPTMIAMQNSMKHLLDPTTQWMIQKPKVSHQKAPLNYPCTCKSEARQVHGENFLVLLKPDIPKNEIDNGYSCYLPQKVPRVLTYPQQSTAKIVNSLIYSSSSWKGKKKNEENEEAYPSCENKMQIMIKLLTKSVGNRFSITKWTPRGKPINTQEIIKKKSLSVLFFQQLLLSLHKMGQFCQLNAIKIKRRANMNSSSILRMPHLNFLNPCHP